MKENVVTSHNQIVRGLDGATQLRGVQFSGKLVAGGALLLSALVATACESNTPVNPTTTKSAPSITPTQITQPFANEVVLCTTVEPGKSVSEAAKRANNDKFPPYQFNGMDMAISLDHNGKREVASLQDIMSGKNKKMDLAAPGDQVCIAGRGDILEKQPTPTPPKR